MTVNEKRKAIQRKCWDDYKDCDECPLFKHTKGEHCYGTNTTGDEQVEENYKIMFGDDDKSTVEATAHLETIAEDCDTIIKIKSSRKIDNISIYFKEETE